MNAGIAASVPALAAVLGAAAPAAAGASPADVRCLLAASTLLGSPDQATKSIELMASMYFTGKVYGAPSHEDLEAVAKAEAKRLTQAGVEPEMKRCGAELGANGKEIQALGRGIVAEQSQPPTATP